MKLSSKRWLLFLGTSLLWSLLASSCNTIRGVGRDVERAGGEIQKSTR